jgi:isoleucyl-tRNA synthetase
MFQEVKDADFVRGEHSVLKFWEDNSIFKKLREQNRGGKRWSFLDGPITANNPMGVHHAWGRTYKDTYQRFFAMMGYDQRYQNGFDCQGLWVEVEVEKQLGLGTKTAVNEYGIDNFVNECKRRVLNFAARQTEQSQRLGYWMDWDDPDQLRLLAEKMGTDEEVEFTAPSGKQEKGKSHQLVERLGNPDWGGSYFTFSTENNETIWTFLKKCFERGKLYKGHDVMPWSGRGGSAYSQMEIAEGRKLTTHKSIFVRFPLRERENEYLLVWTTTPWTLTSNVAAAVNTDLEYVKVKAERDGAIYYFAKENLNFKRLNKEFKEGFGRPEWSWPEGVPKLKTLAQIFKENGGFEEIGTIKGAEMVGWEYDGPFDELPAQFNPSSVSGDVSEIKLSVRERAHEALKKMVDGLTNLPPETTAKLLSDVSGREELKDELVTKAAREATKHIMEAITSGRVVHRVIDGGRDSRGKAHVVAGEGTGIVHIAPGCGDVDHKLGQDLGLAIIAPLKADGTYGEGFGDFTGREAISPETAELVFEKLKEKGLLVNVETYPHIYPHCWRTGDELVFRLVDEWFINMDWREEIKDVTRQIEWLPESIDGQERECEWLSNMSDWMISKKRFWGLALPIWVDGETGDFEVMGSLAELKERAVEGWDGFEGNTPHRPWIDGVKIQNPKTGNLMTRIEDVGNPWLDAGIVPFSTMHYNHDHDDWQKWYPADLVTECFPGQFRNWFYSMLSLSTMMRYDETDDPIEKRPFKTLLGHRLVMDEKGQPMHKSDGTAIWFEEAAEQLGVDTIRWMYLAQNPASDLRFGTRHPDEHVTLETPEGPIDETKEGLPCCKVTSQPADETRRSVMIPLWNSYAFFVNYARLDEFDPTAATIPVAERPEIDRWVLSNLQSVLQVAQEEMPKYNVAAFCKAAEDFLDDLTNWYIRRNRRRFWRSKDASDTDKTAAYQTLYEVLVTLCKALAPMAPFLAERMYQNLVGVTRGEGQGTSTDDASRQTALDSQPLSVHLCEYPLPDESLLDSDLNHWTQVAQRVVRLGHRVREQEELRVRVPVPLIKVAIQERWDDDDIIAFYESVIRDELNGKSFQFVNDLRDLVSYSYKPNLKTLGPRYGKLLGVIRKELPEMDPAILAPLRSGQNVTVELGGEQIELGPNDVLISTEQKAGWATASEDGIEIAISTAISRDLVLEGMSRDLIRLIQSQRKSMGLEENARIEVDIVSVGGGAEGAEAVADMMSKHKSRICLDTRADEIFPEPQPSPNPLRLQMTASATVIGGVKQFSDIPITIEVFELSPEEAVQF